MNALAMIQRCGAAQSGLRFVKGIGAIAAMLRRIVEKGGYGFSPTERVAFKLWLDDPKMPTKVLARPARPVDD